MRGLPGEVGSSARAREEEQEKRTKDLSQVRPFERLCSNGQGRFKKGVARNANLRRSRDCSERCGSKSPTFRGYYEEKVVSDGEVTRGADANSQVA